MGDGCGIAARQNQYSNASLAATGVGKWAWRQSLLCCSFADRTPAVEYVPGALDDRDPDFAPAIANGLLLRAALAEEPAGVEDRQPGEAPKAGGGP